MSQPSSEHARSIALAATLYRWLLMLYPAAFRQRYGADMRQVFLDRCREADRAGGRRALAAFWLSTLADLLKTALAERLTASRPLVRLAVIRLCGLCTLLSALALLFLFVPPLLWQFNLVQPTTASVQVWTTLDISYLFWEITSIGCFTLGVLGVLLSQPTRGGRLLGVLALSGPIVAALISFVLHLVTPLGNVLWSLYLPLYNGSFLLIAAWLVGCSVLLYRARRDALWSTLLLLLGLCLGLEQESAIIAQQLAGPALFYPVLWVIGYLLWAAIGCGLLVRAPATLARARPALN